MKNTRLNKIASLCRRSALVGGTTLVCVMVALAAGQPCDNEIPKCTTCNVGEPCGAGGEIVSCQQISGYWYHCNGAAQDCPNTAGNCNVYVRTFVVGYMMACEDYTVTTGFCASSQPGTSEFLNRTCDGGPCVGPTADELPTLMEGANTGVGPWYVPKKEGSIEPL